jgi:hypothetical protein
MPADSRSRQARLAEIRRQIAAGTYETPEKLQAAVEKMLESWEEPSHDPDEPRPPRMPK